MLKCQKRISYRVTPPEVTFKRLFGRSVLATVAFPFNVSLSITIICFKLHLISAVVNQLQILLHKRKIILPK